MAIAIRGSTPAIFTSATATVSGTLNGTRQPQAGDLLVIIHCNDFYALSNMPTPTVGGSTSGVGAITGGTADAGSSEAHIKSYTYAVGSTGDLTVSVTETGTADEEKALVVYVLSGADTTTPIDVANTGFSTTSTSNQDAPDLSPATADAYEICHVNTGTGAPGGTFTPPSGMTEQYDQIFNSSMGLSGATLQLSASGATGTRTFTNTSSTPYASISITVRTASAGGGGAVTAAPPRAPQYRDPGQAWWLQKDRRNAHLVATAANPLPAPLDSAWQAGARYWHLYDDWGRPAAPAQQRPYVSDPTLLAAPVATIPYAPAQPRTVRDPGQAWWLQGPRLDPTLLATAQLENELLGGGDTARHYLSAATNADRREYPQQRVYYDTTLLATAQLEDPLLSGAEPEKRTLTLATHTPRVWQPQQPARLADQSSAAPAVLDPTLAAWAPRTLATLLAATHADRREYPQQRIAITGPDDVVIVGTGATGGWWGIDDTVSYLGQRLAYDPSLLAPPPPFDPTLGAWLPLRLAWNRAATHADRREVPAQRPYISDPSFYPTVAPTDPLTVAWGAGGPLWWLYNTAAAQVDRRAVPQQRRYVSDPVLLLSALLENELLGSADDLRRRLLAAANWPRPNAPASRVPCLPGAPDADPLTLTGDTMRRVILAAYVDRREVPAQPARWTLYFDAGPGLPPLTLAWGAGGAYWHLYNRPSRPGTFWPQRPPFLVEGCDCTTYRPNLGTTARPNFGTTARPCSCGTD